MAHPHNALRDHHVQKSRVAHIARGYASGGAVTPEPAKRATGGAVKAAKPILRAEGGAVKPRLDRPGRKSGGAANRASGGPPPAGSPNSSYPDKGFSQGTAEQAVQKLIRDTAPTPPKKAAGGAINRAKGGRTNKPKGTNVNVIIAPQGHPGASSSPPMPMGGPAGPVPPPAGPRPMMPPGMPPPGAMPPPGMPPRASGGRAYAKGGGVTSGPAWEEGRRNGTQVQHDPGKNDGKNLGRGKPITYAKGGGVHLPGGSGGGEARLYKERRAETHYKRAP